MDLTGAAWRRPAHGGGDEGSCIEVAVVAGSKEGSDHVVAMRDSKNPDGAILVSSRSVWRSFLEDAKSGGYDLRH